MPSCLRRDIVSLPVTNVSPVNGSLLTAFLLTSPWQFSLFFKFSPSLCLMVSSSQPSNMLRTSLPQHCPPESPISLQCYIDLNLPAGVTSSSWFPQHIPISLLPESCIMDTLLSSRQTQTVDHPFPSPFLPLPTIIKLISKIISHASYLITKIAHDHFK